MLPPVYAKLHRKLGRRAPEQADLIVHQACEVPQAWKGIPRLGVRYGFGAGAFNKTQADGTRSENAGHAGLSIRAHGESGFGGGDKFGIFPGSRLPAPFVSATVFACDRDFERSGFGWFRAVLRSRVGIDGAFGLNPRPGG